MVDDLKRGTRGFEKPRTWQAGLDVLLRNLDTYGLGGFERTSKTVAQADRRKRDKTEAIGTRAEDYAQQEPERAIEMMCAAVQYIGTRGDHKAAAHWQGLADSLAEWVATPYEERDPWEPETEKPVKKDTKIRTLEPEEVAAFFNAIPRKAYKESSTRNLAFFWLLAITGIRVGEGCYLRMEDLHLEEPEHLVTPFEGKTGRRYVPVPDVPEAREALDAWLAFRAEKYPDSPYVFVTRNGNPMDISEPERAMKGYARKAGITRVNVTPHVLRHTFAAKFLRHSKNLRQLQVLLGHKNIQTTTVYLQVADHELQEAVRGMEW